MAFPKVIIECAFSNVLSEEGSAATGYTEITKFVESVSGTLRGRSYELDQIETGSISVALDNSDGRFTPGSSQSPYFPYVRANRRFRIRGKNMQRLNIAQAGRNSWSTDGFFRDANYVTDGSTVVVGQPVLARHSPVAMGYTGGLLNEPYHIEATINAGAAAGTYRVLSWWAPIELGVRSTHSAYIWLASGTEPAGTQVSFVNTYYDASGNEIAKVTGYPNLTWNAPTSGLPTRRVFTELPPGNAAYTIQSIVLTTTAALTTDLTYAVNGVQTEIPTANLVPSISGYYDVSAWQMNGTGTVEQSSTDPANVYVLVTWTSTDAEVSITVPRLVPGDDYTFVVQAQKSGGPDVLLTGDDGRTGDTLTANGGWVTLRTTFTCTRAEQQIKLIPQGTPSGTLWLRLARCAAAAPALPLALSATDPDVTEWERPIPLFEGWVERWPVHTTAFASTVNITVNDRLKKLGDLIMESTLKQALLTDEPDLLMPLSDDSAQTAASISGYWSDDMHASQLSPVATKYGSGSATFAFGGIIGPTEEDAAKLTQVSSSQGKVMPIPYGESGGGVLRYLTTTYYATWDQMYEGDNSESMVMLGATLVPDVYNCWAGIWNAHPERGNFKTLFGFNYASIMADLAGASVTGATFTAYSKAWGASDADALVSKAFFGLHTYASAPTTYNPASATPRLWRVDGWANFEWRTISIDAGSANQFKTGAAKGIIFGPGDSDTPSFGGLEPVTSQYRPYLTITYKKIVYP